MIVSNLIRWPYVDDFVVTSETSDAESCVIRQEVPGVRKDEISVKLVDDSTLTVTCRDRQRVYKMTSNIDVASISAKLDLGVLTITLPKKTKVVREVKIE